MLLVNGIMEIQGSDVLVLEGHTPEYYLNCAWSPSASILASAAKERYLWSISDANFGAHRESDPYKVVLGYVPELEYAAVLDWNKSGTVLAIGYDEIVRIWNFNGELKTTLCGHKDSISALKWSKNNKYILTGSHDKTAVLWDVNDSKLLEKYKEHSGGVSDVDWRNNDSFATCTLDGRIRVYEIGMLQPMKEWIGHEDNMQSVKWDPTGSLLASCSSDKTIKIWSLRKNASLHDFRDPKKVMAIQWSPTGTGTNVPNEPSILASVSYDATVKFWDVDEGQLLCSLIGKDDDQIAILDFSPNGEYMATGGYRLVQIWSVKEKQMIRSYMNNSVGVVCICWNKDGNKLAVGYMDGTLLVLDLTML